jgi:hypothetical protein
MKLIFLFYSGMFVDVLDPHESRTVHAGVKLTWDTNDIRSEPNCIIVFIRVVYISARMNIMLFADEIIWIKKYRKMPIDILPHCLEQFQQGGRVIRVVILKVE